MRAGAAYAPAAISFTEFSASDAWYSTSSRSFSTKRQTPPE